MNYAYLYDKLQDDLIALCLSEMDEMTLILRDHDRYCEMLARENEKEECD